MDIKKSGLFTRPIAHRGLHDELTPENSLSAFSRAVKAGFPIELDVRPIDDGSVVVFHDDSIKRMTNRDGYVCKLSKADLDEIRLAGSDERIPYFAEVLELVDGRVPLLIEIKNSNSNKSGELEQAVLDLLRPYGGEYAVQSFNPYSMEFFKKNAPQIPRGQLSCVFGKKDFTWYKRFVFNRLKVTKISSPDFISYAGKDLPNKYVTKTGLPVLAWTIRSNTDMEKVLPHCDNFIFENFIPVIE